MEPNDDLSHGQSTNLVISGELAEIFGVYPSVLDANDTGSMVERWYGVARDHQYGQGYR